MSQRSHQNRIQPHYRTRERPGVHRCASVAYLAVVLAAPLMAIFDQFVVNVAIPTMQRELHASFGAIQFVIAGYALAYAVLLITGGGWVILWA